MTAIIAIVLFFIIILLVPAALLLAGRIVYLVLRAETLLVRMELSGRRWRSRGANRID